MRKYFLTPIGLLALFFILMVACQKKNDQATSSGSKDLASFPKEWVLIVDTSSPDSITRKFAIPVNTDSSFYGQLTIDTTKMNLAYKDFDTVLDYNIVTCNKSGPGDVIYYDFKLLDKATKDSVSLNVNFRVMPDNPQSSVFWFKDKAGQEIKTMQLIHKTAANQFPHVATEGYD